MIELQRGSQPLVSVIIPVHNGERFLVGALHNVLAQDYAPLEIIVIDDGSSDATPAILTRYADRVRIIRQSQQGPAAARNAGLRVAQGAIIAFLDVDDAWPSHKLQRQVRYLASHPEVDIVQGLIVQMAWDATQPGPEMIFEECSDPYQFVNLGCALYRRAVFETVGLFDPALTENEDTDWYVRAWEQGIRKDVQDQVGLYYRRHDQNMTRTSTQPHLKMTRLFKRHIDRIRHQEHAAPTNAPARPPIGAYLGVPPATNQRSHIQDENFTIIANDCWGSGPYHHTGLLYRTPFIGTRLLAPCYLELLKNPKGYLAAPAEFISTSRYDFINARRAAFLGDYPIALLDGAIELHFVHETETTTAWQKWRRRSAKINWDNLYIKFSEDPECCPPAMVEAFDRLDYPYKVCFTYRDYPALPSAVCMPDYFVEGAPMYYLSRTYFDAIAWLNKTHGPATQAYRRQIAAAVS